jgi:replicative superfamily II helicase
MLGQGEPSETPIHPIELFHTLFHQEGYEYMRGVQEEILKEWDEIRPQRDIIGKMNTGAGKTLTGLLMLYSKLIEGVGPVIYACPDHQLVTQTVEQSERYGIPVCVFEQGERYPSAFENNEAILICVFDKVFNGKSIFVEDKIEIGAILLDDAHACVAKARQNSTITMSSTHALYERLLTVFEEELKNQSAGTFAMLKSGDPSVYMRVPYWSWMNKHDQLINIINEYREDDLIKFQWRMICDDLLQSDCLFSAKNIEISPIHVPYYRNSSFNEAKHRFVLSATFEDDTYLLRDLGIDRKSIQNPLVPGNRKDIGERLILAPSRYDGSLTDEKMRIEIAKYAKQNFNVVVLVPSEFHSRTWVALGAKYYDKKNIDNAINTLKLSKGNLVVFANRYDGIDLLGDACRILVLDGKPSAQSLKDRYIGSVRAGSSVLDAKTGQIIDQGLGRAVRSGSDYCVTFILNVELVSFLGKKDNMKYFAPVTAAQINLGIRLLDNEDRSTPLKTILNVVELCLTKNVSWRKFHQQAIANLIQVGMNDVQIARLNLADIEQEAMRFFKRRNYESAGNKIISFLETDPKWFTLKDTAWYLQFAAQLFYLSSIPRANDLQIKAGEMVTGMFHPQHGPNYAKLNRAGEQAAIVRRNIAEFVRPQDVSVYLETILDSLQFNQEIEAEGFEGKLAELGRFLGFSAQEPETELGAGPDVLWCMTDSIYLILEAKSRTQGRKISKGDMEQLYHSERWFKRTYGEAVSYFLITLQKSNKKERDAETDTRTFVMDQTCLDDLRSQLKHFINSIMMKQTDAHTEKEIGNLLRQHRLTSELFRASFLTKIL